MKVAEAMRSSKNSEDSSEPPEDLQAFLYVYPRCGIEEIRV
jgi:hypothetical protein